MPELFASQSYPFIYFTAFLVEIKNRIEVRLCQWECGQLKGHVDCSTIDEARAIAQDFGFGPATPAQQTWFEQDVILATG